MNYKVADTKESQVFQAFTQSSTGGNIPTCTYTYSLQDWTGSALSGSTATQVSIDTSTRTLEVYEADGSFSGAHYELAVKAVCNEVPTAYGYAIFQVNIYTFSATD